MIQAWLDGCVNDSSDQHTECAKTQRNTAPLRLLHVMDGNMVRLVETGGLTLKYAILSYCWGPSAVALASRTLKSNISTRLADFPVTTLTQTLQDGIHFARSLQIQYIWIDSICIVQDSDEWLTEAGRMMEYYENSFLTIIPIACHSADQSFLSPYQPWASQRLSATWVGHPDNALHFYYPQWEIFTEEAATSFWASRAWTFQERLLSTRALYFGQCGIGFECRSVVCRGANNRQSNQDHRSKFLASPTQRSPEWDNIEKVRSVWYELLAEYVDRELTFASDKLIALSGVVEKFKSSFGDTDEYISGFWKNDLCHGLCWKYQVPDYRRTNRQNPWSPIKSPDFPSWSSCSMKRPVIWPDGSCAINCAELLEKVKSSDDKKCGGKNEYAKLVLKAWVFSACLLEAEPPQGLELQIFLDAADDATDILDSNNGYEAAVMTVYLDGGDEIEWKFSPSEMPHYVSGMILEKAGSQHGSVDEYRRVGTFHIMCDWEGDSLGEYVLLEEARPGPNNALLRTDIPVSTGGSLNLS